MKHSPSTPQLRQAARTDVCWKLPPPAESVLWRGERGTLLVLFVVCASVMAMGSIVLALVLPAPANSIAGSIVLLAAAATFYRGWRLSRTELTVSDIRACRLRGAKLRDMPLGELTSVVVSRSRWQIPLRLADVTIRVRGDAVRFGSIENWEEVLRALALLEGQRGRMLQLLQKSTTSEMYVSAPADARKTAALPRRPGSGGSQTLGGSFGLVIAPVGVVLAGTLLLLLSAFYDRPRDDNATVRPEQRVEAVGRGERAYAPGDALREPRARRHAMLQERDAYAFPD